MPDRVADARDTPWHQALVDIENILADGQHRWAEDTLRGIQRTIEKTERVTVKQLATIRNIDNARRPGHDWARRYPWPTD